MISADMVHDADMELTHIKVCEHGSVIVGKWHGMMAASHWCCLVAVDHPTWQAADVCMHWWF